MWEDCWDLNTWGWGWRTLTNRACSCTGRCQSSALKWAARGQCGGCIGVRGFPWSKWTRDGAAWERGRSWEPEAVKPEDDTKKAVMVCRGPQLGSRTDQQATENCSWQGCRAWGHSQLAWCSVFSVTWGSYSSQHVIHIRQRKILRFSGWEMQDSERWETRCPCVLAHIDHQEAQIQI